MYSHTLQSFPLVARRTASPRPLMPSRRYPTLRPTRPQGLARSTNPLSCTGVATSRDPMLSWAFIPFRALPTRSARESRPVWLWLTRTRTRTGPTIAGASCACVDLAQPTWNRDSGSGTLRLSEVDFSILFFTAGNAVAATSPGLSSCTCPRANAKTDTQADPSKTILNQVVASLLYFEKSEERHAPKRSATLRSGFLQTASELADAENPR